MNIVLARNGWEDFTFWIDTEEDIVKKIKKLIKSIKENPFKGPGSPEPLRYSLRGFWSRRIIQEHRLLHKVTGKKGEDHKCIIIQCRYHFDD